MRSLRRELAGLLAILAVFASLAAAGAEVVAAHSFPDHHLFQENELAQIADGLTDDVTMVTTEKDWQRLSDDWRSRVTVLPVEMRFSEADALEAVLRERLARS